MERFISNRGVTRPNLNAPRQISMKKEMSEEDPSARTPEARDPFEGMTPKERLAAKKRMKVEEEIAKMKEASKDASKNYQAASQRRHEELYNSTGQHK